MKKTIKLIGGGAIAIAAIAVLLFAFAGCIIDTGDEADFVGTWTGQNDDGEVFTITFTESSTWSYTYKGSTKNGTYSVTDTVLLVSTTATLTGDETGTATVGFWSNTMWGRIGNIYFSALVKEGSGMTSVSFYGVTQDARSTQTTTELTLSFSRSITGLTAADVTLSGVTGVTKGTLSQVGNTARYRLPISGFTSGGTLTVRVAKANFGISPEQTVTIYHNAGAPSGVYVGIIGFNNALHEKNIAVLDTSSKGGFDTFIDGLSTASGTALYHAVNKAVSSLAAASLPADLTNVSIVTFTDGLDNASIDLDESFNTVNDYRDHVNNRIKNDKIRTLSINAYSIGVQGNDVSNETEFTAGVKAMASNDANYSGLDNMDALNDKLAEIAASLYSVSSTQTISLTIPGGYDDGTIMRFTFAGDAAASSTYIQGTYKRDGTVRRLDNVTYVGMTGEGTSITGVRDGIFVTFTFNVGSTGSGVPTDNIKHWTGTLSDLSINSEFDGTSSVETTTERKSAAIILVLDCSNSLGTEDFAAVKAAAKEFIDILNDGQEDD